MKCDHCGTNPKFGLSGFTCRYCSGFFCVEHRLPPKHNCPRVKLWNAKGSLKPKRSKDKIHGKLLEHDSL
ncbi:MAG: AN1-type zinc finger domain-containing protein [Candidatus Bathyarchaeia archaeon]